MKQFLLIFICYLISFSISDDDKLIFLYTHFRHGARAPQAVNSTFYDMLGQKWTNPGELTGMGQRMHYLLGLRNRIKYIKELKFLSEKYDPHEILIFSSAINRTIISASSQLQGLYPLKDELGLNLTKEQEELSVPQVSINYSEIIQERANLNLSALPHLMTLVPVRLINDNDRKINVYDLKDCVDEREEVKATNLKNISELQKFVADFNTNYGERVNKYFGTSSQKYDIVFIYDLCDAFVSDYTDRRNISDFERAGFNLDEFHDYCMEFMRLNFLLYFFGDEEKVLARLDSSKLMNESIYYMKRRVDADINGVNVDENYNDYSRPKMVMISGHDSTSSSDEYFMLWALGYNVSATYKFPKFANQIALEVARKNDGAKKSSYSDYFVKCYFNDDLLFNVTLDEFINKIEAKVWNEATISVYCGFEDKIIYINNSTNTSTGNSTGNSTIDTNEKKKKDHAKTAYKVLMSVFICLAAIFLATTLLLAYKLSKANQLRNNMNVNNTSANNYIVNKTS